MSAAYQLKLFRALRQVGLSRNPHQLHPARSIPRVHSGKYQQSARISTCTENAGAEGFSNGPNPVDPPAGDRRPAPSSE